MSRASISERPSSDAARYAQLDVLRALAAWLVLLMHGGEGLAPLAAARGASTSVARWASALDLGRAGVVLFFAISGFVIPSSIKRASWPGAWAFLRMRFARLFPAYWLSIPLGAYAVHELWGDHLSLRTLLLNATMLPQTFRAEPVMGIYWTLRVEWIFYALCMALHLLGCLRHRALRITLMSTFGVMFMVGSVMELQGQKWGLQNLLTPHMAGFVSLLFYGSLHRDQMDEHCALRAVLWFELAACVLMPLYGLHQRHTWSDSQAEALKFFFAYPFGVLCFALGVRYLRRGSNVMSRVGKRTYALYLFHPVILSALCWWLQFSAPSALRNLPLVVHLLLLSALSLAAADVIYRYVELPGVALGRRFGRAGL